MAELKTAHTFDGEAIKLTQKEERMLMEFREEQKIKKGYNQAIREVVFQLNSMADQCCGGSGEGGSVYRMLAEKFDKMFKE